tara:strand:- start:5784 stop:6059 length:276 start_codon:yes stop_codon:yes gene_type:complete
MTEKKHTKEETIELASSLRGQYIIGKALYVAVEQLKKEEYPPISDIEQMEEIGEALFEIGYFTTQATEKFKKELHGKSIEDIKSNEKCEEQ